MSLKCIRGKYKGNSLFINRNNIGEVIGSNAIDKNLTLALDCEKIESQHIRIIFEGNNYLLSDLSTKEGIFHQRKELLQCCCEDLDMNPCFACDVALKLNLTIFNDYYGTKMNPIIYKFKDQVYNLYLDDYDKNNTELCQNIMKTEFEAKGLHYEYQKLIEAGIKDLKTLNSVNIESFTHLGLDFENLNKINAIIVSNNNFTFEKIAVLSNIDQNVEKHIFIGLKTDKHNKGSYDISRLDESLKSVYLKYDGSNQWMLKSKAPNKSKLFFKIDPSVPYIVKIDDQINIGDEIMLFQRFETGISQQIGSKKAMEDIILINQKFQTTKTRSVNVSLFSIFDGHNGRDCAQFISSKFENQLSLAIDAIIDKNIKHEESAIECMVKAFENCYMSLDQQLFKSLPTKSLESGATALTVCIIGRYVLCANLGDSKAFISRNECPFLLSRDLRPVS